MGFLAIEFGGFFRREIVAPTRAHLVDQVGEALLEGLNGGVLVVGPAWPFQEAQQQHPGALLLADP